jgi:hypothetical protein
MRALNNHHLTERGQRPKGPNWNTKGRFRKEFLIIKQDLPVTSIKKPISLKTVGAVLFLTYNFI